MKFVLSLICKSQSANFKVMKRILIIFCITITFLPKPTFGQQDSIDAFVIRQMKQQGIAGLSLGIIKSGKVVKAKGYGLANIELNVPATEKTMFKIGSISKQFIASGIMKLVEEGKLKLSDHITKFIKGVPDEWKSITIGHLLNHTSGLPLDPPQWEGMKDQSDSLYIKAAFSESLIFPTGSKYEYSNFGYFFLADIIRITTHLPFSEYMKKYVFEECGLNKIRTTSLEEIVNNRSDGYIKAENGSIRNAPNYTAVRPSGAFLSDINDLLKWELILQNDKLLTQKSWNQMWEKTIKTPFTMDNEPIYYGYGWMTNTINGKQVVHHGGSMPGFKSVYVRYIEDKTAIIVLTNSDDADAYGIAFGVSDLIQKAK
jgi:CubicO group peptidase (beta-lactamase class C family)